MQEERERRHAVLGRYMRQSVDVLEQRPVTQLRRYLRHIFETLERERKAPAEVVPAHETDS